MNILRQDAVRVAASVLERGGKIAVHCHAVSTTATTFSATASLTALSTSSPNLPPSSPPLPPTQPLPGLRSHGPAHRVHYYLTEHSLPTPHPLCLPSLRGLTRPLRLITSPLNQGFGRTGLLIASVLMLRHGMSPATAISTVRTERPRSIQTKFQVRRRQ